MSSGSESDDDYVPEEPEKLSEEESADEETAKQYENEVDNNKRKRKRIPPNKGKKKFKVKNEDKDTEEPEMDEEPISNPEEEKKREEDLWAKFLEGTDSKPKPQSQETNNLPIKTVAQDNKLDNKKTGKQNIESDKDRERRIFEFAGETIVVENNVIKEKVKTAEKPALDTKVREEITTKPERRSESSGGAIGTQKSLLLKIDMDHLVCKESPRASSAGGLSSIVGQLNKKNKLSTLEKSKLDWNTYKKEEGIEEEITSHNKGKDGYLDRQDFLGRTDVRQYEIERDLRMTRRSNR